MAMRSVYRSLQLSDGIRLAFQEWLPNPARVVNRTTQRVVAVHGWLDNSNTFVHLAPILADNGYHVIAVDHIGHGLSEHLGTGAAYSISKSTACFADFVQELGWSKFHLVGHSMGATISMMFAASMHEYVDRLVLIEGFGPVTIAEEETARNLRKALDSERRMRLKNAPPKPYSTFADAIDARVKAVASYPGQQTLSREAAKALVSRGVELVCDGTEGTYADLTDEDAGPVRFRHDKRLVLPSFMYHSNTQVMAYVNSIAAPTLLITAKHGWPVPMEVFNERRATMVNKGILTHVDLEGSHHLHLDPAHCGAVADHVTRFLNK